MMLCSKRHRQGIALSFLNFVTPFHRFLFGDWPLGTPSGHVGCRHCAALPCAPSHERGEYGDPVVSATSSQRPCLYQNGMEQVGEQLVDFKGRAELVKDYITGGKSSCENPQPPGLRQWNVQVLF